MNFLQELESSNSFILESQGTTILGLDEGGYAVAQTQGESSSYFIKDQDGKKIKEKVGDLTLSSAERINSKNYLALVGDEGQITTWRMTDKWRFKKVDEEVSYNTDEYINQELKFSQSFGEPLTNEYDQNKPQSNFWSSEPEAGRLWGFYNFEQYKGALKGADAKIFQTFSSWSYPSSGVPSNTKNKDIIAIIDTGVNYNHEELNGNMYINSGEVYDNGIDDDNNGFVDDIIGYDFHSNRALPWDTNGHGTHVGGTAGAAANNRGVIGSNPTAKILGVQVLGPDGSGYTSDIIEGFNYSLLRGAKVINLSLGGPGFSQAFKKAIDTAGKKYKAITVAAAGNDYTDIDANPTYPASYTSKTLVTVASSGLTDEHSDFSNWGKKSVDLYAPGEEIFSPWVGGESAYKYIQGTSMATPLVSGIISSYWSRNPNMKPKKVIKNLLNTVDDIGYSKYNRTGGRVNMERMFGYTRTADVQSGSIELKEIPIPTEDDIIGKPIQESPRLSAYSKQELKGLEITDSLIIDFKGSFGLVDEEMSRITKKFARNKYREYEIDIKILEAFDSDLATLDFGDRMPQKLKAGLCRWLFKNDLIEYIEIDSIYQAV